MTSVRLFLMVFCLTVFEGCGEEARDVPNGESDPGASDGDSSEPFDSEKISDTDTCKGEACLDPTDDDSGADGDADSDADVPLCDIQDTLKAAADCTDRLIGTSISLGNLNDASYKNAASEFSYATAENEMKWEQLEPNRGSFNWGNADQIVSFAASKGMKVKGHTLVWHSQLPAWVQGLNNETDVRNAMNDHIKTVMNHYKGKVIAWDVVNEAWETDSDNGDGNPRLRESVFKRYLGEGYIDEAFQIAKETDPSVKLYYNDFSIEARNDKADAVYEMLSGMVERGVPIDGVGFQTHIGTPNNYPTADDVAANMKRIAELGLEIVISEMDIHLCGGKTADWQQQLYHDVVAACVAQPACKAITFWGITDKYSWLNGWDRTGCGFSGRPQPLLWDDNYNKKDTYTAVMEALTGR